MEITPTTRLSIDDVTTIKKITDVWSNPYDRKKLKPNQQKALTFLETITPDIPLVSLCRSFQIAPSQIMYEIERAKTVLLLQTIAENTRLFNENKKLQIANKELQAKNLKLQNVEQENENLRKQCDLLKKVARESFVPKSRLKAA
jgi:hypothetical protein